MSNWRFVTGGLRVNLTCSCRANFEGRAMVERGEVFFLHGVGEGDGLFRVLHGVGEGDGLSCVCTVSGFTTLGLVQGHAELLVVALLLFSRFEQGGCMHCLCHCRK